MHLEKGRLEKMMQLPGSIPGFQEAKAEQSDSR